jgi:sporulation protein YlmC with PRC-barrel domain
MADTQIHIQPKVDDPHVQPGMLAHLGDLNDYMIGEAEPDVRGWDVMLGDGRRIGKVDDLIVDTDTLKVKYLEVKVDDGVLGNDKDTYVLVPIGAAKVDDDIRVVEVDRVPGTGIEGAPRYAHGNPTPEQEREIRKYFEPATRAASGKDDALFDERRFWGRRRAGRENTPYLTRRDGRGGRAARSERSGTPIIVEEVIVQEVIADPGRDAR